LYKGSNDLFCTSCELTPRQNCLWASSFVLPKQAKGLRTEKCFAFFDARLAIQLSKEQKILRPPAADSGCFP
jgi:hypothetical protein